MKSKYQKTLIACYLGFITQAIAANFAPLLFLTFHRTYQISLGKIAFISTAFFFTQLLVDLFCAKYVDRIGYPVWLWMDRTCCFTGTSSGSIRWYSAQRYHLCDRKWPDRSAGQSHCRSLSFRKQRGRNEPSAFLLLLGIGRCYFAFYHLFCRFRDRKLAYSGLYLGIDPVV